MPDAASAAGFAMLCFSAGMAHLFYRSRRRWWQTVLAWTLCFLASGAIEVLLRPIIGSCSAQLAGFTSAFVYLYLFDVPVKQRLFTCFFGNTILYLTALLSRFTVLLIHGFWSGVRPEIAFVALYVVLTGAAVFLLFRHLRTAILERLAQFEEHLGILTGFAFLGYVLLILLFGTWGGWDGPLPGEYLLMLLYPALLACGYGLSFVTMAAVRDTALAQVQVRELTDQTRQAEQYYVTLSNHIQEVRRMQHDSRHHLRVLSGYVHQGAYDGLKGYLDTLIEQSPEVGSGFYCANYTANILLDFYGEEARDRGIDFRCDAQIPAELACSPVDLCTVLGNALQNALDACELQGPEEERYLSLLARVMGNNFMIELRNSFDGVVNEEKGRLASRKRGAGHGLGMASIRRTAEKYHGYCDVTWTNREFTLRVVLALENE